MCLYITECIYVSLYTKIATSMNENQVLEFLHDICLDQPNERLLLIRVKVLVVFHNV